MKFRGSWPPKRPLVPLALFLFAVLWIVDRNVPSPLPSSILSFTHQKNSYEAIVATGPTGGKSGYHLQVKLTAPQGIPLLLTFPTPPPLNPGDTIRFQTRLKRPPASQNPGSFNYRHFLERKGIFLAGFVAPDEWERVGQHSSPLAALRKKLGQQIDQAVPMRPSADFLQALLLGDRTGLTPQLWNDFQKTGTAHLLAISGQHVGLVAACFFPILLWLLKRSVRLMLTCSVRKIAALLSILPPLLYVVIAGSPPSAVRAWILLLLVALSLWFKRDFDIYATLAFASIVITWFDHSAPFSASFQLSFLAVLSLSLLVPPLLNGIPFERFRRWQRWLILSLAATTAATLGTAPLVAYRFHLISISGLLTNLWAIPAVGLILCLSFFALLLIPLIQPFGHWTLLMAGKLAGLFLFLIHSSAHWSLVIESYPTEWQLFLAYLILTVLTLLLHKKISPRLGTFSLFLLLVGFVPFHRWFTQDLKVTFLDVGQGDAALLITPQGSSILIDGGGFLIPGKPHPFDIGREVVVPYLKREGIGTIDLIILSHPHPDHYGGLQAVVDAFPVKEFWWNGQSFPDETFKTLMATLSTKTTLRKVTPFITTEEGVTIEILYPPEVNPALGINDNCLVIRIVYGETSFLFAGDIEKHAEGKIAALDRDLRSTVLKIPHHGSRTSSSIPFIDKIVPQFAVASLAEGNMFGFPHEGVLEKYERRGVTVYRTDQNGAVTFRSNGKRIRAKPFVNVPLNSPTAHTATPTPSFGASRERDKPVPLQDR